MYKHTNKLLVFLLITFITISCKESASNQEEEMLTLASALTKLSASVEASVRYEKPDESLTDAELLNVSTKHDPALLTPFIHYQLKVLRENLHAIVLVCTKDGKYGLLEDAGCSSEFDNHLWKDKIKNSCSFTLSSTLACAVQ